jgi:murein DD-endopeptidase MepM/ murein hydrolase activator NlpD
MPTNKYALPLDKKHIKKIITKEAPGHIKYKDPKTGSEFDLSKCVDFICDKGTPVKAVLSGEVVRIKDSNNKTYGREYLSKDMSRMDKAGNFVIIKHANGKLSEYSHLSYKKVIVKEGQKVRTGQVIGYSGNVGLSLTPHLHFMIFRFLKPYPKRDFESLEVRWKK